MLISIPIPQKISTNAFYSQSLHWSKRKKLADLYHMALIEHRNKRITDFPCELTFIYTFKGKLLDVSNCSIMTKMLEDGLVAWKIIPDDTLEFVSAHHIYVKKGKNDSVNIHIS